MKKTKIKEIKLEPETYPNGIRYYWCVNCGFRGNFKKIKFRNINCKNCNYDMLTILTKEEYYDYKEKDKLPKKKRKGASA